MSRPILIDEADGACEICREWAAVNADLEPIPGRFVRACGHCGNEIGVFENMGGAGFQSPLPDHFHIEPVLGVMGRKPIRAELCLRCYQVAHEEAYPNLPLPQPPMELVTPKMPKELLAEVDGELEVTGI